LIKSLYGLKQAPKQWHEKFDKAILLNGFHHNGADKCMYSKFTKKKISVIICLYVDDMLIYSINMIGIVETKRYLTSIIKMKDLGKVDTILDIKVKKQSNGYALNQSHYIEKMLDKFKHLNIEEVNTLFDSSMKLNDYCDKAVAQLEYANVIGSFMYVMHYTRPDIAFAICKLSRYTSKPNTNHWKGIARVFGYLKRTIDLGLFYSDFPTIMDG